MLDRLLHAGHLRLERKLLLPLLVQRLLRRLQRLVAPLHPDERHLPLLQQLLLLEVDRLHLRVGVFERLRRRARLSPLRDELRLRERQLLLRTAQLLVERVDQHVLLLLAALQRVDRLLGLVRCAAGHGDLRLHLLVVRLYLLEGHVQLVELRLKLLVFHAVLLHLPELLSVRRPHLGEVSLGALAHLCDDRMVLVDLLQVHLKLGQLLLHLVQLHANVFSRPLLSRELLTLFGELEP
mmetsp:Transcript_29367/g.73356  ORF Transcript_29367/g.73356 Transcript_29367/m.73356 type:complete len:238 (-) Transcript_29367:140-853(-)